MNSLPTTTELTQHKITMLLIDDQAIVAADVKKKLADQEDIVFHYCADPTKAIEKANEIGPTVILQDLVMPDVDGLTLVKFFRANEKTKETPLIVLSSKEEPTTKAQAFANGANDYLVKPAEQIELIARIRHHSQGYINLLQRNEAFRKLEESQKLLAEEVAQAAHYVQSLLPPKVTKGDILIDWRFIPSTQLGGDSFGYHWLDDDHLAMYLLDVTGHGVGASLLSVSAMNVLSSQSLPNTDFHDPSQVLRGLNEAFNMEKHNFKFFTIWYGVYQKSKRNLVYAGGGHPPALLFAGDAPPKQLESAGLAIGVMEGFDFDKAECQVPPNAILFIYSDGLFEISHPDGSMWKFSEFVDQVTALKGNDVMDRMIRFVRDMHGSEVLADDCSIMHVTFA